VWAGCESCSALTVVGSLLPAKFAADKTFFFFRINTKLSKEVLISGQEIFMDSIDLRWCYRFTSLRRR